MCVCVCVLLDMKSKRETYKVTVEREREIEIERERERDHCFGLVDDRICSAVDNEFYQCLAREGGCKGSLSPPQRTLHSMEGIEY